MRVIPIEELELPTGWQAIADAALAAVEKHALSSTADRNKVIDGFAKTTWRKLKALLSKLSHEKCWYCESRQDRSPCAVDHFRPKGGVQGLPSHPGYWWLAFTVDNFRFTCTLCNSPNTDNVTGRTGGKHDQFPLYPGSIRATDKTIDYKLEDPMLLDPLVSGDPILLTWLVNGEPAPRYSETQNKKWHDRAAVSIRVYHLDHNKLNRRRRLIYNRLKSLVLEGDLLFGNAVTGKPFQQESLNRVTNDIITLINERAEYSAAANQFIVEFRTSVPNRTWLDSVLSAA